MQEPVFRMETDLTENSSEYFPCEGQFWAIFHAKNITHFTSQKLGYSIFGERESVKCDDWFWHDRGDS
jgi:hypothetical protein